MKRIILLLAFIPTLLVAQTTWTEKSAKKWVRQTGNWQQGFNAMPDKTTDYVAFATQYEVNTGAWDALFEWLASTDLQAIPVGQYFVGKDSVRIIVQEANTRPAERCRIEGHRKFVDFQYVVSGIEQYTLQYSKDTYITVRYNDKKDVSYHELRDGAKARTITSHPSTFCIFFPSDLHQVLISPDSKNRKIRKIVAKITYVTP